MERCHECQTPLAATEVETTLVVAGHTFTGLVPALRCVACGAATVADPDLARFELAVAAELARAGVAAGTAFKFMRKALGLRAVDRGALLDATPETVSRWETGPHAPDRGARAVLGSLVVERLEGRTTTLDRLHALREPRTLAKTVRLGKLSAA
jgi:DNA-binding transcriptional regulator YiaG